MSTEATERKIAVSTGHSMRAAAIRLARQRMAQDDDPAQAYGCVDWFRYDAIPPVTGASPPPAAAAGGGHDAESSHH